VTHRASSVLYQLSVLWARFFEFSVPSRLEQLCWAIALVPCTSSSTNGILSTSLMSSNGETYEILARRDPLIFFATTLRRRKDGLLPLARASVLPGSCSRQSTYFLQKKSIHARSYEYLTKAIACQGPRVSFRVFCHVKALQISSMFALWLPYFLLIPLPSISDHEIRNLETSLCQISLCRQSLGAIKDRFLKLYKRRTYVHHYTEYMDQGVFDTSAGKSGTTMQRVCFGVSYSS
jgi:hypothetical protein